MAGTAVVSRENVLSWDADSDRLYLFRRALEEMQSISTQSKMDERGFQWVAGVHGGFGTAPWCHHGDLHFLTWHRPYVLDFELKLRDQIRKLRNADAADEWRLPYWEWDAEDVTGLPEAFTVRTYKDKESGTTKPNPLAAQPYQLEFLPGVGGDQTRTWRDPGTQAALRALRTRVERALNEPDFSTFSRVVEGPHNSLHGWVGGFMQAYRSSFDPIFWVHHCNVDRQFWKWQQKFGESSIPDFVRRYPCQPFNFRDIEAQAFFDTRQLGYTYAETRSVQTRSAALAAAATSAARLPPRTLDVALGPVPSTFDQARLHFHSLEHTQETLEVRIFAHSGKNGVAPTAKTAQSPAHGYLGSYVILGHGECPGAPGHCDAKAAMDQARQPHHLAPFDAAVDVTDELQHLFKGARQKKGGTKAALTRGALPAKDLKLQLVVVDMSGKQVPASERIRFHNISLTTR
jgi:tyrosinase